LLPRRFDSGLITVRFVSSSKLRVALNGIDAESTRPSSNTWPVRIRRAARNTVSGFM
jgi:hypothetical protein